MRRLKDYMSRELQKQTSVIPKLNFSLIVDIFFHHQVFKGYYFQFANYFQYRVAARYVRILPQTFRGYKLCMRAELIGCAFWQGMS